MALPGSSSDCRTKTSDALVMNVPQKQKTHLPEYMAVGSLQSWSRELLESWLPIQTIRGGRHRWVRTTTNAGQLDRSHSVTRIPNSLRSSQSSFQLDDINDFDACLARPVTQLDGAQSTSSPRAAESRSPFCGSWPAQAACPRRKAWCCTS